MSELFLKAKGFLFDLDGVFFIGDQLIDGAVDAIHHLRSKRFPCRFTTNTTTKSIATFHRTIQKIGLPIEKSEIISSPYATVQYLRQLDNPTCHLILSEDTKKDFAEFPSDSSNPDFVVIGDIGDRWNYDLLNKTFAMIMNGAEIIALHKGKYWQVENGLKMDIGAFVAGLEYVTGKKAMVMGKPSKSFFDLAIKELGLAAEQVVMMGDDIDSDVGGAQNAGLKGVLVKTGKYRSELVARSSVKPDAILSSVADIINLV